MDQSISSQAGMTRINDMFYTATYRGDYAFDRFLSLGGAKTEDEAFEFLKDTLAAPAGLEFRIDGMGCSTMQAKSEAGYLFGRNFDWDNCPLLVLTTYPDSGYSSISSVNMDFVVQRSGSLPTDKLLVAAHYAPLDGMNQKGLCVSVNLLPDGMELRQSTGKPHLTITTAIRLILDLLQAYDLGTTTGLTIHYLISDASGHSVCVEFIHNVLSVIETPVMTNHYLTPGPYFGLARNNSLDRYDQLMEFLGQHPSCCAAEVKTAMAGVFHGTQWTVIYDQACAAADFYHKDCYDTPLRLSL